MENGDSQLFMVWFFLDLGIKGRHMHETIISSGALSAVGTLTIIDSALGK